MSINGKYIYGDQTVQVPAHLNFGKFLLDRLRLRKDEVAIVHSNTSKELTYKQLTQDSVNLAVALKGLGVGVGDIVAIGSEKRNECVPTILGIVYTGATYTPHDIYSGRAVLQHKLSITNPKYFICSKLFCEKFGDILQSYPSIKMIITLDEDVAGFGKSVKSLTAKDVDLDRFEPTCVRGQSDVAFILYSSGTTGMPKGVQLTHLNCILNSIPDDFKDESLKTMFIFGGWAHNYSTFMTYKFLAMGRKIVYLDEPTPLMFLKTIQDYQVDIVTIIPSLVGYLSKSDEIEHFNLDSLKIIYCRSAPLHVKTIENVIKRLPKLKNVLQGYGMTEAGELTSENWSTNGLKTGSIGKASPGITLKVVDPNTNEVFGPNQRGEIRLRGPVLMKGYIGIDPSTYLDQDGWFKTGDLGYYDEDGYFYIVDRIKEIMCYNGHMIAPIELETILQLHPGVREAGVVGKPVPDYGEEPTAFVVRSPGSNVTAGELIDYVSIEVPPYMQLRGGVKFLDVLPRNPTGKILRRELRDLVNQ